MLIIKIKEFIWKCSTCGDKIKFDEREGNINSTERYCPHCKELKKGEVWGFNKEEWVKYSDFIKTGGF